MFYIRRDWLEFSRLFIKEALSDPPTKPKMKAFVKKNPLIPTLPSYHIPPPASHFKTWPYTAMPPSPSSPVNTLALRHLISLLGPHNVSLSTTVLADLEHGASLMTSGVGRLPSVSTNAPSAAEYGERTSDALATWISRKYVAGPLISPPFTTYKCSPLMSVLKPASGDARPIINLSSPKGSSVNDGISKSSLHSTWPTYMSTAKDVSDVIVLSGWFAKMSKADQVDAYKLVPIASADLPLQVFSWLGLFFVDLALIMGSSSSAMTYDRFHALVVELSNLQSNFPRHLRLRCLDDLAAVAPAASNSLSKFFSSYVNICYDLNIKLADFTPDCEKAFLDSHRGTILGVTFDSSSMSWSFSYEKQSRLYWSLSSLAYSSTAEAQLIKSVTGKVINFSNLFPHPVRAAPHQQAGRRLGRPRQGPHHLRMSRPAEAVDADSQSIQTRLSSSHPDTIPLPHGNSCVPRRCWSSPQQQQWCGLIQSRLQGVPCKHLCHCLA